MTPHTWGAGLLGAALVVGSLVAEHRLSQGEESSAGQTRVCLGSSYSLGAGCEQDVHSLTQPEFGRAYVVTDAAERAGVDQYELYAVDADGNRRLLATRQTATTKVPRYVLGLGDLLSAQSGPPDAGRYELVTVSAGSQASYALTVTAPEDATSSTGDPTGDPTDGSATP